MIPESILFGDRLYIPEPEPLPNLVKVRVVWDDENPDYDYKCRTQRVGWEGPDNPPAVMRYYPEPREKSGDYRVNLESPFNWKPNMLSINGGSLQTFNYLVDGGLALYNSTGWPMQAYLTMSGNFLYGEFLNNWFRFITLVQADAGKPINQAFVQKFTCVTWDLATKTTKRIPSTGTPRGEVFFFLATREGKGYIPARHVVRV